MLKLYIYIYIYITYFILKTFLNEQNLFQSLIIILSNIEFNKKNSALIKLALKNTLNYVSKTKNI